MARDSNEFTLAWNSLFEAAGDSGWRTISIAPAGLCALSAGRRFPGNEEALLAGFSSAKVPVAEKLPDGHGFTVQRVNPLDDGKTWLALTRNESGNAELFLNMVCDVTGTLDSEAGSDEPRLLMLFLGRVRAWQEFMRKGAQALSPEAEVGLIGELSFLRAMIMAGVPSQLALESWVGPLDGIQDFEIGYGAVEVKTTLSMKGFPAKIGSLEQLDDSVRKPLFVAGTKLLQLESGMGLPDFISELRAKLGGDAGIERLFADRLLAAGFHESHSDGYTRRFSVERMLVIQVGEAFPRIVPGTVPYGIRRAIYEIDLDMAPGEDVGAKSALKLLGAL